MLTIEEIKKELDAGRDVDLECIDEEGFITSNDKRHSLTNATILGRDEIKVSAVEITGVVRLLSGRALWDSELKYFRIKRPDPTFDDLIDSAANAIKKKLIVNLYIGPHYIEFDSNEHSHAYDMQEAKRGIDFINSLYTETFVIESEEDVAKVKIGATVKLVNGNESDVVVLNDPQDSFGVMHAECSLDIFSLYGATVTQKRGEV